MKVFTTRSSLFHHFRKFGYIVKQIHRIAKKLAAVTQNRTFKNFFLNDKILEYGKD